MSNLPDLSHISHAISVLQDRAQYLQNVATGGYAHDAAYRASQIANLAAVEMRKLEAKWSAFLTFVRQTEKAYDTYVCNPIQECTCHINPPCNFCIEKSIEENEEGGK